MNSHKLHSCTQIHHATQPFCRIPFQGLLGFHFLGRRCLMCGRLRCAYFVTHVVQPNSPYVWPQNSATRSFVTFSLGCRCSWCLTAASHAVLHAHFGESPLSVCWRGLNVIILLAFCPNCPNTRECYYDEYFIMPCILGCRCRWCLTAASPR